jgi:hypothetical protein
MLACAGVGLTPPFAHAFTGVCTPEFLPLPGLEPVKLAKLGP